jgi:putative ubiquitin-RnfH superfamily antitoxin RatB of RatAB toxin-antitoxin module
MDKPQRARSLVRRQPKNRGNFPVQVSCAMEDTSVVITVHVKRGTTIREAFELSNIRKIAKNVKLVEGQVGIFSEIKPLDTIVRENDRIEIYRPLATPPKETRKKRLEQEKSSKTPVKKKRT